jgi:hypothetical protein
MRRKAHFILIVIIAELSVLVELVLVLFVVEGLASEVVDSSWDDLSEECQVVSAVVRLGMSVYPDPTHPLLEVLSDLVVNLQLLIKSLKLLLLDITLLESLDGRWLRRFEEVEERVCRDDLLDDSDLLGVCKCSILVRSVSASSAKDRRAAAAA